MDNQEIERLRDAVETLRSVLASMTFPDEGKNDRSYSRHTLELSKFLCDWLEGDMLDLAKEAGLGEEVGKEHGDWLRAWERLTQAFLDRGPSDPRSKDAADQLGSHWAQPHRSNAAAFSLIDGRPVDFWKFDTWTRFAAVRSVAKAPTPGHCHATSCGEHLADFYRELADDPNMTADEVINKSAAAQELDDDENA